MSSSISSLTSITNHFSTSSTNPKNLQYYIDTISSVLLENPYTENLQTGTDTTTSGQEVTHTEAYTFIFTNVITVLTNLKTASINLCDTYMNGKTNNNTNPDGTNYRIIKGLDENIKNGGVYYNYDLDYGEKYPYVLTWYDNLYAVVEDTYEENYVQEKLETPLEEIISIMKKYIELSEIYISSLSPSSEIASYWTAENLSSFKNDINACDLSLASSLYNLIQNTKTLLETVLENYTGSTTYIINGMDFFNNKNSLYTAIYNGKNAKKIIDELDGETDESSLKVKSNYQEEYNEAKEDYDEYNKKIEEDENINSKMFGEDMTKGWNYYKELVSLMESNVCHKDINCLKNNLMKYISPYAYYKYEVNLAISNLDTNLLAVIELLK